MKGKRAALYAFNFGMIAVGDSLKAARITEAQAWKQAELLRQRLTERRKG